MTDDFIKRCMELIHNELTNPTTTSADVLFHLERNATDWTPEQAVECLFRYASNWGWDSTD